MLGAFPSAFSYPAESHDSPTPRSEPLLAEQPPREIQHEHAFPDIGPMPHAGDEDLRECIPDGQKQREPPLERRFRADVVSRLNFPSRFRNREGNTHANASRGESWPRHVSSDIGAHSRKVINQGSIVRNDSSPSETEWDTNASPAMKASTALSQTSAPTALSSQPIRIVTERKNNSHH